MSPDGPAHALAEGDPHVWQRLLREHVPREDGRCALCSLGAGHGRPHWPCRLHAVAESAASLVRARLEEGESTSPRSPVRDMAKFDPDRARRLR